MFRRYSLLEWNLVNETLESKSVLLNLLQTRWLKNTREDRMKGGDRFLFGDQITMRGRWFEFSIMVFNRLINTLQRVKTQISIWDPKRLSSCLNNFHSYVKKTYWFRFVYVDPSYTCSELGIFPGEPWMENNNRREICGEEDCSTIIRGNEDQNYWTIVQPVRNYIENSGNSSLIWSMSISR